jgi:hypothetical protein
MKMSMEMGGMMLTREDRSTRTKTFAVASLSITNWQWYKFFFTQILYKKSARISVRTPSPPQRPVSECRLQI